MALFVNISNGPYCRGGIDRYWEVPRDQHGDYRYDIYMWLRFRRASERGEDDIHWRIRSAATTSYRDMIEFEDRTGNYWSPVTTITPYMTVYEHVGWTRLRRLASSHPYVGLVTQEREDG